MEVFFLVLSKVSILYFCMAIGYILQKLNYVTKETRQGFTNLLIYAAVPCSILYSMQKDFSIEVLGKVTTVLVCSTSAFFFGTLVAVIFAKIFKVNKLDRGVLLTSLTLPNGGFMGIPVISSILGPETLFYLFAIQIPFNIIAFTFGVKTITKEYVKDLKIDLKKTILSPAISSTIIGFLLFVFSIKLPSMINEPLQIMGSMMTPLSMIIIGSSLAQCDFKTILKSPLAYIISFLRLVFVPLCVYFILSPFIKNAMILNVITLTVTMPVGAMVSIFASQYDANEELASKAVSISTLFSIVTIPLLSTIIL